MLKMLGALRNKNYDEYTADFTKIKYEDTMQKFSLGIIIKGTTYYYDLEIDFFDVKSEKLEI